MRRWLNEAVGSGLLVVGLLTAGAAVAGCVGSNLIDALPADIRAELDAATDAQPYATVNVWTARKGDRAMTIVGTYHLSDPRHAITLGVLGPLVDEAKALLVEAGPEEEAALMRAFGDDPGLLTLTDGPSLLTLLPKADWEQLSAAMTARGIPSFMAAKFRPWYVSVMLGMPPCAMADMAKPEGLDKLLVDRATASGIPVQALEPYDTIFALFDEMSMDEQLEMIRSTLLLEDRVTDLSVTLADQYFRGESRSAWEYMRILSRDLPGMTAEKADAEMARMEDLLMIRRNRAWIPVIEAASEKGPIVAAFGALHLSGKDGVLNLLDQAGWALSPFIVK